MTLKIDFVSDVSCPWCAVGLASLQVALDRVAPDVKVDITFQPFELNPNMLPEGEDTTEHLRNKYGSTPEQAQAAVRQHIAQQPALTLDYIEVVNADTLQPVVEMQAPGQTALCLAAQLCKVRLIDNVVF